MNTRSKRSSLCLAFSVWTRVMDMRRKQVAVCDWCGDSFEKFACEIHEHNFCCFTHFRQWNAQRLHQFNQTQNAMNKPGGVMKSRIRRGNLLRGKGEGRTYTKRLGRHEHRVVAEQMLGRPLREGEVVHHMDGNKKNNAPENLLVFPSQKKHAAWHARKGGDADERFHG